MRYLIFGGTGSLGKKLIQRLSSEPLTYKHKIAVYSRDEAKHWTIKNDGYTNVDFFVGDVRDIARIKTVLQQYKPNRIIIAAALKQVDTCEYSPYESVQTNLLGTHNILQAIEESNELVQLEVESVLFVSTDKACSPINVYGMCKSVSERLVTNKRMNGGLKNTRYLAVRYGNVLESRGSIIPLFKFQSESEKISHLTVTNPEMTRFVMTLDEAVNLIQTTFEFGKDGELWLPVLPSMKIGDLAEIYSEISNKPIKIIGTRPGEKLHEDLINESEAERTHKCYHDEKYLIMNPVLNSIKSSYSLYSSSQNVMTKNELRDRLESEGILKMSLDEFVGSKIEHIAGKN